MSGRYTPPNPPLPAKEDKKSSLTTEEALQEMLVAAQPDLLSAFNQPHIFAMEVLYLVEGDEALDIARSMPASRADLRDWWDPGERPVDNAYGPICISCGKMRGPQPTTTLCESRPPQWLRKKKADEKVSELPRRDRREVKLKARRLDRKRMAPLPSELRAPAKHPVDVSTLKFSPPPEWQPTLTPLRDPEWDDPEAVSWQ